MTINRPVLFSAVFIGVVSGVHALLNQGKLSRVLIGTYVFILVCALLDVIGLGQLAAALALLAALYVGMSQFPWQQLLTAVGQK